MRQCGIYLVSFPQSCLYDSSMLWCLYFAPFHDCVYSTLWIYHNWFNSWTFWFLPFCDNTNNVPLHILMFVFCAHKHPFLHGIYLGVDSLGHRVSVSPSLIEAVTLCSKTCASFLPLESLHCHTASPSLTIVSLPFGQSGGCSGIYLTVAYSWGWELFQMFSNHLDFLCYEFKVNVLFCFVLIHFIHSGSELFVMFIVQISFLTLAYLFLLLFSLRDFYYTI